MILLAEKVRLDVLARTKGGEVAGCTSSLLQGQMRGSARGRQHARRDPLRPFSHKLRA